MRMAELNANPSLESYHSPNGTMPPGPVQRGNDSRSWLIRAKLPLHPVQQWCIWKPLPCAPLQQTRWPRLSATATIGHCSLLLPSPLHKKLHSERGVHPLCTASARTTKRIDPRLTSAVGPDDLEQALSRMDNHMYMAPAHDDLPTELLKYCGATGRKILLLLFSLLHDQECIPRGWREGSLVSVPKSRDLTKCCSYRGLTLLPAISKLSTSLLLQRASPRVELHDHQYGFRHGPGTADALFCLHATVRSCVQRSEVTCLSSSTGARRMTE
jgi:hypothetical protein